MAMEKNTLTMYTMAPIGLMALAGSAVETIIHPSVPMITMPSILALSEQQVRIVTFWYVPNIVITVIHLLLLMALPQMERQHSMSVIQEW